MRTWLNRKIMKFAYGVFKRQLANIRKDNPEYGCCMVLAKKSSGFLVYTDDPEYIDELMEVIDARDFDALCLPKMVLRIGEDA